jgi:hypothetical protein
MRRMLLGEGGDDEPRFTDVTFVVENRRIPAHK